MVSPSLSLFWYCWWIELLQLKQLLLKCANIVILHGKIILYAKKICYRVFSFWHSLCLFVWSRCILYILSNPCFHYCFILLRCFTHILWQCWFCAASTGCVIYNANWCMLTLTIYLMICKLLLREIYLHMCSWYHVLPNSSEVDDFISFIWQTLQQYSISSTIWQLSWYSRKILMGFHRKICFPYRTCQVATQHACQVAKWYSQLVHITFLFAWWPWQTWVWQCHFISDLAAATHWGYYVDVELRQLCIYQNLGRVYLVGHVTRTSALMMPQ